MKNKLNLAAAIFCFGVGLWTGSALVYALAILNLAIVVYTNWFRS